MLTRLYRYITFRPVQESDIPIIYQWLREPHISPWRGEVLWTQDQVKHKVLHVPGAVGYIMCKSGKPIGYCQTYVIDAEHAYVRYRRSHGQTVGIRLVLGDPAMVSAELGYIALQEVVRYLCQDATRVVIDPYVNNDRIMRLCYRYGYREEMDRVYHDGNTVSVMAINIRRSVRAILRNDYNEILLMRVCLSGRSPFWCTIGGRIELGERHIETLQREISEETGLHHYTIGKLRGLSEQTLQWGDMPTRFIEWFYDVRAHEDGVHTQYLTYEEKQVTQRLAWWSLDDIRNTDEIIYPESLPHLLAMDWSKTDFPVYIY